MAPETFSFFPRVCSADRMPAVPRTDQNCPVFDMSKVLIQSLRAVAASSGLTAAIFISIDYEKARYKA